MFKSLLIILFIVFIAAITTGCGVTGALKLPEGETPETVF
jgi:predicted small lipoprotein YifL